MREEGWEGERGGRTEGRTEGGGRGGEGGGEERERENECRNCLSLLKPQIPPLVTYQGHTSSSLPTTGTKIFKYKSL